MLRVITGMPWYMYAAITLRVQWCGTDGQWWGNYELLILVVYQETGHT